MFHTDFGRLFGSSIRLNLEEDVTWQRSHDKLVELTGSARQFDPTCDFLTLDGDRDMDGRLPVWSKHFSHGLKLDDLPKGLNKSLIDVPCDGHCDRRRRFQVSRGKGEET